jgi:predicted small secreted protein
MIRRFVLCLLMLGTLTACNTIQGVGEDIKEGGAAIDRAVSN